MNTRHVMLLNKSNLLCHNVHPVRAGVCRPLLRISTHVCAQRNSNMSAPSVHLQFRHNSTQKQRTLQHQEGIFNNKHVATRDSRSSGSSGFASSVNEHTPLQKFDLIIAKFNQRMREDRLQFSEYQQLMTDVVTKFFNIAQSQTSESQFYQIYKDAIFSTIALATNYISKNCIRQKWTWNQIKFANDNIMTICTFLMNHKHMIVSEQQDALVHVAQVVQMITHLLFNRGDMRVKHICEVYELFVRNMKPQVHIPVPYVELIEVYSKIGNMRKSAKLYRELKPHLRSLMGIQISEHDSQACRQCHFLMRRYQRGGMKNYHSNIYSRLAVAFVGDDESVINDMFEDISMANTTLQEQIYSSAIPNYFFALSTKARDSSTIDRHMESMKKKSIPLNRLSYNNILSSYVKLGSHLDVKRVFEEMDQASSGLFLGADTFNIALSSCKTTQSSYDLARASYYLNRLEELKLQPHLPLYTTLLNIYLSAHDFEAIKKTLDQMKKAEITIDDKMVATVMRCFLGAKPEAEQPKLGMDYLENMRSQNLVSADVYNVILLIIANDSKERSLEEDKQSCNRLLDMMMEDGIQPNDYTLNALMSMLNREVKSCEAANSVEFGDYVMNIVKHTLMSQTPPSLSLLTSLISFYSNTRQFDRAMEILDILKWKSDVYAFDAFSYCAVIGALTRAKDVARCISIGNEIFDKNVQVDRGLYEMLMKMVLSCARYNNEETPSETAVEEQNNLLHFAKRLFVKHYSTFYKRASKEDYSLMLVLAGSVARKSSHEYANADWATDRKFIQFLYAHKKIEDL